MSELVVAAARPDRALVASRASVVLRADDGALRRAETRFEGARCRAGEVSLSLELDRNEIARTARVRGEVKNEAAEPVAVERVALVFELPCGAEPDVGFLRNGWQSWSKNAFERIDAGGDPPFPSGAWLRGMHHAVGERAPDRADWHESHTVCAIRMGGAAALAGIVETGLQYGLVNVRRAGEGAAARVELELEWVVERTLAPGEFVALEDARVSVGADANRLLEDFATAWGKAGAARTRAPFQAGWCSWYHFFHDVTEEALLRNLDALAARRDELPVALVQLDDGYQRAIGDWLETNEKFPSGLPFVARRIIDAGFEAGLWTAPFSAVRHSHLLGEHPDWALRGDDGEWLRGTLIPEWSEEGWCYALDPSHPGFLAHVERVHRALVEMGFTYQKLDFLYMASMRGGAHDPKVGRAERLAAGLDAVRRGAGDDAFLLGCGRPMGPAVGRVDGMRIGPDVAPTWDVDAPNVIPGIEPALPATGSAVRSIATRLFMHRRLWLNDPDCLMVRRHETKLSTDEIGCLADAIGASGGMVVFSDDVDLLGPGDAELMRRTADVARSVDASAPWGVARLAQGPNDGGSTAPCTQIESQVGTSRLRATLNLSDAHAPAADGGAALAPHASRLEVSPVDRPVAVFCDFDGTFIDQDVGSGIARRHLAAEREAMWRRFEGGGLDAWTYAVELFTGFDLPESDRIAFLDAIEIDPGAERLVELCRQRGWRFEVLSDGFDVNIDHLRTRFGVDFAYRANHLEIGDGGWQLSPGGRPTDCACGTGTCKRRVIEAHRAEYTDAVVVHVGNGRVSDLCGALEADWAFAKDTLVPALEAVGRAHLAFDDLGEVADALEAWLPRGVDAPSPVRG